MNMPFNCCANRLMHFGCMVIALVCTRLHAQQESGTTIPNDVPMRPELRERILLIEPHKNAIRAAQTPAERSAAAVAARAAAEARIANGITSETSNLFSIAVSAFEAADNIPEAIATCTRLINAGEDQGWVAYGYLRRGDLRGRTEHDLRTTDYASAVQTITAANLDTTELMTLQLAVIGWARELSRSTSYQQAIDVRNTLRTRPGVWDILPGKGRAEVIVGNARDYCKLNQVEQSQVEWDRLEIEAPTFGFADGSIVMYQIERIGSCQEITSATGDEVLERLQKLWDDERFSSMPEIMACGSLVIDKLAASNQHESSQAWRMLALARWKNQHVDWLKAAGLARWQQALNTYSSQFLGRLGDLEVQGKWPAMVSESDDFLNEYGMSEYAPMVRTVRARALTHL